MLTLAPSMPRLGVEVHNAERYLARAVWQDETALATESKQPAKKGRLGRLTWEFDAADTFNNNARVYPKAVYALALADLQPKIDKGQVMGALDHPSEYDPEWRYVKYENASHMIVEAKLIGDRRLRVVADVINNEKGRELAACMDCGNNPGISQRASASWRSMSNDEKERFGVPADQWGVIADALRLYAFDIVAQPGFEDATDPAVMEHKDPTMLTAQQIAEFRKTNPELAAALEAAGKAVGLTDAEATVQARVTAAVEAAKPEITKAAQKDLATERDTLKADLAEAKKAMETVKPVMVKLGVVNEHLTDATAIGKIAELTASVATEKAGRETDKARITALEAELSTIKGTTAMNASFEAVYAKHKGHAKIAMIMDEVKRADIKDAVKAVEHADRLVALIGVGGGTGESDQPRVLRFGNIEIPLADSKGGSGGTATEGDKGKGNSPAIPASAIANGLGM